jgi:hypothetical protein
MKTHLFNSKTVKLLFVSLFITTLTYAQNYIDNSSLNTQKLSDIFKNAYVEVLEVQSTYLKIKDKYTSFVDLDAQNRYISISGNYVLQPNNSKIEILDFINKLNNEVALVKSYYLEANNSINFIAYLWVEKGFTDATLIRTLKSYNLALDLILEKDPNAQFIK